MNNTISLAYDLVYCIAKLYACMLLTTMFAIFFWLTDLVAGNQRNKTPSRRCSTVSRYVFKWAGITEKIAEMIKFNKPIPAIQSGILRLFLQTIPRLLDDNSTEVNVTVTANLFNGSYYNSSESIFAGEHYLDVSADSNGWVELNITEGLQGLWPPTVENSEIEFVVRSEVNCVDKKKVPATFVDPAEIPLEQKNRRQRHLNLQPLLVVYISDDYLRQQLVDEGSNQTGDGESLSLGEPQRRRRSTFKSCDVEDFSVSFRDLGLEHIIAPYSANIRQCSGSCSHTAIKRNPSIASNHAKVMASAHLVSLLNGDLYTNDPEEPCCVPTKYSSINLLIQHRNLALELSIFPDFIVETCGCR